MAVIAQDAFGRTVSAAWGNADVGGAWALLSGTTSPVSVSGGVGKLAVAAGGNRTMYLSALSAGSTDVKMSFTMNVIPTGDVAVFRLQSRLDSTHAFYYNLNLIVNPGGGATMRLNRNTTAMGPVTMSIGTLTAGTKYWVRMATIGASPTTVMAKFWQDGTGEPNWMTLAADSTVNYQTTTGNTLGVFTSTGSGVTNGPITFNFDDVLVTDGVGTYIQGPMVWDTFNRTATAGVGTSDDNVQWGIVGTAAKFNVAPSALTLAAAVGDTLTITRTGSTLPPPSIYNETLAAWSMDTIPTSSGAATIRQLARQISTDDYHLRISLASTGVITAGLYRADAANLGAATTKTYTAGRKVWARVQAYGVSPTIVRYKWWFDGDPEPTSWDGSVSDSAASMQVPGDRISISFPLSASAGTPVTYSLYSYTYSDVYATPVPTLTHVGVYEFQTDRLGIGVAGSNINAYTATFQPTAGGSTTTIGPVTPNGTSGWAHLTATGLLPNTPYTIVVSATDGGGTLLKTITGTTLNPSPANFKALTGSCSQSGGGVTVYNEMAAEGAAWYAHQGDLHYADATTEAPWLAATDNALSRPAMQALLANTPMNYHWDNHDWGGNSSYKTSPVSTFAPADIRTLMGTAEYPDTTAIYSSWSHGGVRFVDTDQWALRDEADPAVNATMTNTLLVNDTFTGNTSTLGGSEKGWIATSGAGGVRQRWTHTSGPVTAARYGGGYGVYSAPAGATYISELQGISGNDLDITAEFAVSDIPVGGTATFNVIGRRNSSSRYMGNFVVDAAGAMTLKILLDSTQLAGGSFAGTYVAGTKYKMRFKVTGTAPTQLQVKLWASSGSEPGAWTYDLTDSTAALQAAANAKYPGLMIATAAGVTNSPLIQMYGFSVSGTATVDDDFKAGKTMLGATQLAWLLNEFNTATEPLIIWFCSFPLYGNWVGNGRWGNFRDEADIIWQWLNAHPQIKARIVCVGGDSHNICADDGTNTMFNLPSLNASPIDWYGTTMGIAGGTWNISNMAINNVSGVMAKGYYSRLNFTWFGSQVLFAWEAVEQGGGVVSSWSKVYGNGSLSINSNSVVTRPQPTTVAQMLAQPQFKIAQRGGSSDWPEMSRYAYNSARSRGMEGLEFCVGRSSDGVFFGIRDPYLDRTSFPTEDGSVTTLYPNASLTWAQIQNFTNVLGSSESGPQPYYRLDDFLSTFGDGVVLIDANAVPSANYAALLTLMESYDPTHVHLVAKDSYTASVWPAAARAKGFQTFGYFTQAAWAADNTIVATNHSKFDFLGIDSGATAAAIDSLHATGKKVVGFNEFSVASFDALRIAGVDGHLVSAVRRVMGL